MSSEIAIKLENLSKCYHIYDQPRDRLKQFVMPSIQRAVGMSPRTYHREFWALKGVSFEVKKGETVGVIGRNGSGKSTLLQLICGTLNPTSGSIQAHGRIAALLELGSGFNPEFTGRENVYLNGAVSGLSKDEIDQRFDDIAAFADIGDFIEQPIKTYSSGMVVRLAFSVNIMSQPEIMVVDEALAVGDIGFQAKCMTALRRIQDNGATVLFVSHDTGSIKSLCSRVAYLERGQLKSFDTAAKMAEQYVRVMREEMSAASRSGASDHDPVASAKPEEKLGEFKTSSEFDARVAQFRYGVGGAKIFYAEILDEKDQPVDSVEFNQRVKLRIYFEVEKPLKLSVNYYVHDNKKNAVLGAGLLTAGEPLLECEEGARYALTYTTALPLQEGDYGIHLEITRPLIVGQSAEFLDVIDDALLFKVRRREPGRLWAKVYIENTVEVGRL